MQFVRLPYDQTDDKLAKAFGAVGTCNGWTNPKYLYQNSVGNYGTYSGTAQDRCAVMVGNTNFTLGGNDLTDAVQITLTGHASVVDGVNNIVSACLTLDGASCKGNTNTYTLGTSDSTICVPTASSCNSSTSGNRPNPWSGDPWSTPPLRAVSISPPAGESPATTGISANANFGVLIWKSGTGTGTLSLQNLSSLYTSFNVAWYDGGEEWAFNNNCVNDGNDVPRYFCEVSAAGGRLTLYWIRTDTGEARFLGMLHFGGGIISGFTNGGYVTGGTATFSATLNNTLYFISENNSNNSHVLQCALPASGSSFYNASVAPNTDVPSSCWSDLTPAPQLPSGPDRKLRQQLRLCQLSQLGKSGSPAELPDVDFDRYNTKYARMAGRIRREHGQVVAAMPGYAGGNVSGTPNTVQLNHRWCGFHTTHPPGNTNWWSWTDHVSNNIASTESTLNGNIDNVTTTISINYVPTLAVGSTPLGVIIGDVFQINSECMQVTGVNSPTSFIVNRAYKDKLICTGNAASHTDGTLVQMICQQSAYGSGQFAVAWWDFVDDPHGTDNVNGFPNTLFDEQDFMTAHYSYSANTGGGPGTGLGGTFTWSACVNYAPATNCANVTSGCDYGLASCTETVTNDPPFAGLTKNIA
jgi:hypothetical protein